MQSVNVSRHTTAQHNGKLYTAIMLLRLFSTPETKPHASTVAPLSSQRGIEGRDAAAKAAFCCGAILTLLPTIIQLLVP